MAVGTKQKVLSSSEAAAFCGQMYMILKSGISAMEGVSILLEDSQNEAERKILEVMNEEITRDGLLAPALRKAGVFPEYLIHMTELGEDTGTLDEVMNALQTHYQREDTISRSIRSAMTYPLVMTGMMILIIVILMTRVMPVFQQVFRQLGREMTGFSRAVLAMGNTMTNYAVVFIIILIAIILFLIYLFKTESGRNFLLRAGYRFTYIRNIYEKQAACRFAGGMYLGLKSGINPEKALELSSELIDNIYFRNKIISCKELMENGMDLSNALQETKIFTGVYARLTAVANRAGAMDEAMNQIAGQYEEDMEEQITGLISRLEPTLVIILSVIVGVILFSVMLPLLGIMSAL